MTKFIKKLLLFVCCTLLLSIGLSVFYFFYNGITADDVPAPNLSDSYSYNEKMLFLHTHPTKADILTIGSSMSLNNLSSEIITEKFHSASYLNTASWGMTMKDNFLLLKILSDMHLPSTIILASNIPDFQNSDKKVRYPVVKDYLAGAGSYQTVWKTFNLKYYLRNFSLVKKIRSDSSEYTYLGFDRYGAVNYDGCHFVKTQERWDRDFLAAKTVSSQYDYLDSIAAFCKTRNITLFFFQSPIRQGLYSRLSREKINKLNLHTDKIKRILEQTNHLFVNANNTAWNDSLFVDGIHFHKEGARLFTAYCLDKIKSREIQQVLAKR